ncbi:MAG: hypothetical protein RJA05_31 [Planctomycetota bacterium]|jgi:hypothetical protein
MQMLTLAVLVIGLSGCGEAPAAPEAPRTESSQPLPAAADAAVQAPASTATDTPATAPPAAAPATGASIAVDRSTVDLGFITPRSTIEHTFRLTNTGGVPLKVMAVKPSCTCTTTINLDGTVIAPGATLDVPASMRAPASTGQKQVVVNVVLQGIPNVVELRMVGEIAFPVRATTSVQGKDVPYVDADSDPSRVRGTVKLKSTDGKPFLVRAVQGQPPVIEAFDPAKDAPRAEYTVAYDLTQLPRVPPYLVIETDHPGARLIDLRVRHATTHIKPVLSLAEFRVNAGCVKVGAATALDIEIKNLGMMQVTGVTSADPRFTATLAGQTGDGKLRNVAFTLVASPQAVGFSMLPVTITVLDPVSKRNVESTVLVLVQVDP